MMSYTPIYALLALVLLGGSAFVAFRLFHRVRSARQRVAHEAHRARIAETWARRNDRRPR